MPNPTFHENAFERLNWWLDYYAACWALGGGRPKALAPARIFRQPVEHNAATYRWLERKHRRSLAAVDTIVQDTVAASTRLCLPFGRVWQLAYNPQSVWKQIRPLFAFAEALEAPVNSNFTRIAAAYVFCQGVPSMIADLALDAVERVATRDSEVWHLPFTKICDANANALLQQVPDSARYFSVLQKYS